MDSLVDPHGTPRGDSKPSERELSRWEIWLLRPAARAWARRCEIAILALIVFSVLMPEAMAQEARVRSFFTKARDLLIWIGPAVTIGSLFWGGANVLRERPAGKQWTAAAIFLALTILSGVLQDWWR